MEFSDFNVIYVHRAVAQDRCVKSNAASAERHAFLGQEPVRIARHVDAVLECFHGVYLCSTGGACLTQWLELRDASDLVPTVILIDTPPPEQLSERPTSRPSQLHPGVEAENHDELYGLALLERIITESQDRNLSKLVVAVPILSEPGPGRPGETDGSAESRPQVASESYTSGRLKLARRCLEIGAAAVLTDPISGNCITNLGSLAYRAHLEAAREREVRRNRKVSWVGIDTVNEEFAALREDMVSKLLSQIRETQHKERGGTEEEPAMAAISVSPAREAEIVHAVSRWGFCAYDLDDDELVVAASMMFQHVLSLPELEKWRIPIDQLQGFLVACRKAYNHFVPFHNFRHVVDVMQATFHFLIELGSLPPFPTASVPPRAKQELSPIALLVRPFEALTLLVAAIGHDVGHPGVNNGFLMNLDSPLAQIYNHLSPLESFHCAAYSQILRRHWTSVFEDKKMRMLIIESIMATDMSLHFRYIGKLKTLIAKVRANNNSIEGWPQATIEEQRTLLCKLLIKCADISNVARRHDTSVQWMHSLSDEFAHQASLENKLGIPSALAGSHPVKSNVEMVEGQLGFMNNLAVPLFKDMADFLPEMHYTMAEIDQNKDLYDQFVLTEKAKVASAVLRQEEEISPRTMSFAVSPDPATEAHPAKPEFAATAARQQADVDKMADNRGVNGLVTSFEPVLVVGDGPPQGAIKQRCSETTDGSVPYNGDWTSQATSATTSKMPLSPSTPRTSIISRESLDQLSSVPATGITAPESTTTVPEVTVTGKLSPQSEQSGSLTQWSETNGSVTQTNAHINGVNGGSGVSPGALDPEGPECKTLRKKPSWLRTLFRRHKTPSPPLMATEGGVIGGSPGFGLTNSHGNGHAHPQGLGIGHGHAR